MNTSTEKSYVLGCIIPRNQKANFDKQLWPTWRDAALQQLSRSNPSGKPDVVENSQALAIFFSSKDTALIDQFKQDARYIVEEIPADSYAPMLNKWRQFPARATTPPSP